MNTIANWLVIFFASIIGGVTQSTAGIGFAVFMMLFLPIFLPIPQSSALSSIIAFFLSSAIAIKYRKEAKLKLIIFCIIFYCIVAGFCIKAVSGMDMSKLKLAFGACLIALAVYFIFFSKKLKIKANALSSSICGAISGLTSGLFGIGGPPMAIYLLAATEDNKIAYLATSQMFFTFTGLYSTAMRILNGIITIDLLPLMIPGLLGMYIGKWIGTKIVDKINIEVTKKIIYAVMAFSGLITLISNI